MCMFAFQSTLPARGATTSRTGFCCSLTSFQSTLPARGATRWMVNFIRHDLCISIHAPRTGSDRDELNTLTKRLISIHAPRTGSDLALAHVVAFKSISIHAPRTGSDHMQGSTFLSALISIHAPRTGSDKGKGASPSPARIFQSTLPARGATGCFQSFSWVYPYFNPRSPHGERRAIINSVKGRYDFNPRSPHGERLLELLLAVAVSAFQSTLPARGATMVKCQGRRH